MCSFIEIHREGDKKLFNLLEDYDIPVTVFSAGLTGEYVYVEILTVFFYLAVWQFWVQTIKLKFAN